jgi:SLT domain-containing protein
VIDKLGDLWSDCSSGVPNPFPDFGGWADDAVGAIWDVIDALRQLADERAAAGGYQTGSFYTSGGMAMVGEAGPEMVFMPRGSRVMSSGELASQGTARALPQQASPSNTYNISNIVQDQASMALLLHEMRRGRMARVVNRF